MSEPKTPEQVTMPDWWVVILALAIAIITFLTALAIRGNLNGTVTLFLAVATVGSFLQLLGHKYRPRTWATHCDGLGKGLVFAAAVSALTQQILFPAF